MHLGLTAACGHLSNQQASVGAVTIGQRKDKRDDTYVDQDWCDESPADVRTIAKMSRELR